jgi:hypothetical protein
MGKLKEECEGHPKDNSVKVGEGVNSISVERKPKGCGKMSLSAMVKITTGIARYYTDKGKV